jgi:glycerophosphoryl diester phosphodiesterase
MIEIKKSRSKVRPLVNAVGMAIQKAHAKNKNSVVAGSFSLHILEEMRYQMPDQPLVGILEDFNMIVPFRELKLKRLAIWYKLLSPPLIQSLHEEGTEVWAFTVDDFAVARFLVSIGIDGIITNDPRGMKTIINSPFP